MPELSKESNVPLYHQLAAMLRTQIHSKVYAPGAKLPTERDLMEIFDVSRNTVRLAVGQLETEGLVKRDQGRGTFIQEPKLQLGLMKLTSFSEDMQERNLIPSTKLIDKKVVQPLPEIAKLLKLLPFDTTLYVERLRYADGIPMAINVSHFTMQLCPGLIEENLETNSIYKILENKYGVRIKRGEQVIKASRATAVEAELLQISKNDPLLVIEGVVYSEEETPIEHLRSIYRSDRYEFFINPVRVLSK